MKTRKEELEQIIADAKDELYALGEPENETEDIDTTKLAELGFDVWDGSAERFEDDFYEVIEFTTDRWVYTCSVYDSGAELVNETFSSCDELCAFLVAMKFPQKKTFIFSSEVDAYTQQDAEDAVDDQTVCPIWQVREKI